MAKYKELLAENLTAPMKMEIDGRRRGRKQREDGHGFRLRELCADVHAGRKEDSVRVE